MSRPFIPVPNTASIELIYSYLGEVVENVVNVSKGSPYTLADLQAVRTIVNAWDAATWYNYRAVSCTLQRIRTKARDSNTAPMEDFYLPVPRAGAVAAQALPGNVSFAIKAATATQGRSFRGRLYLPGLTGGQLEPLQPNHLLAATITATVAALNGLMATLSAAGHTMVVVSLRHNHAWRTTGVATQIIGWLAVDNRMDSMRRRLEGRGP